MEQRRQRWTERLEHLHGKRTREVVTRGVRLVHVGGKRAEEAVADPELERRGSVDLARFDETRPPARAR